MQLFRQIKHLKAWLKSMRAQGATIGLVPTMGALHDGHLSLVENARKENNAVVTSIFVNPLQFNNSEDLHKYPNTFEEDIALLESRGNDVVFAPERDGLYPTKTRLVLNFDNLEHTMEGQFRPGHFNGVGIVVAKLLNIVQPDSAYFGQKDLQQFAVVQRLVNDLSFDVQLRCIPTVREPDGLALSSRNRRLSISDRNEATIFYASLKRGEELIKQGMKVETVRQEVKDFFKKSKAELEYFELIDTWTLQKIDGIKGKKSVALCIAGYLGAVRLIDNVIIHNEY
ncbi:pantoate--beta-alanine ligase [Fulvivirga sp. M361]|uniref:pantoate--beta-alanine ligase n=1 Tax=Fulvivirga sp. M361 TaxID=2594266 RepID=UPI00117B23F1|nr:pantoate--beta-alanine ligase [Fulvivirga sp. M361]TRX61448.1 pantoate--beta-alanine ligase [Fulvivirga sp. M361]